MKKGQPLSDEHKAKMRRGRERYAAEKRAAKLAAVEAEVEDQTMPGGYGSAPPRMIPHEEPASPPRPVDQDAGVDPYQIWVTALDAETRGLFTEDELKAEFAQLWKQAKDEQKVKKKKAARELALSTARGHLGLLPAQTQEALATARQNAKPVSMMIELPPALDNGDPPDAGLRVNGNIIPHGKRWTGTYGEAASLREMLYRLGQHELLFKGNNIRYRSWMMGRAMGTTAMQVDANERGVIR